MSKRWKPGYGAYKRGLNSKVPMAVDAVGHPVIILITLGTTADCSQARKLIASLDAEYLLANRGYDSNNIINQDESKGMIAVIPFKKE